MVAQSPIALSRSPAGGTWSDLMHCVAGDFKWADGLRVTSYVEALAECRFQTHRGLDGTAPPADAFEGRLFAARCEMRWVSRGEGRFEAWLLREHDARESPLPANALPVEKSVRRYYLIGHGTLQPGEFREARYPGKSFHYPLAQPSAAAAAVERSRTYVDVAEYRRLKPDWSELQEPGRVNAELDAPLLVAHRFVEIQLDAGIRS